MVALSQNSRFSFDRVAEIYDTTRGFPPAVSAKVTEFILGLVSPTRMTKFLEPGIGTGRLAGPLAEKGFSCTGVDISPKMLNQLRSKAQHKDYEIGVIRADASAMPFLDKTFDVVLTAAVLHLIPTWKETLREIRRVMKPTGSYLYCWMKGERTTNEGLTFSKQWDLILAGLGVQLKKYGGSDEDVFQQLKAQGATLDTVAVTKWSKDQTVGETIDLFARKTYSELWQIPDDVLANAVHELREWCTKTYESLNSILSYVILFHITVARFPK